MLENIYKELRFIINGGLLMLLCMQQTQQIKY